ncbi:MAG: type II/IV secretion system ATPase subunit [Nitrososphaerales archaeon]
MLSFKSKPKKGDKDKDKDKDKEESQKSNDLVSVLKITHFSIPEGFEEITKYPLNPPFSYAVIAQNPSTAESLYLVDELPMSADEKVLYNILRDLLERRLTKPDEGSEESSFNKHLEQLLMDTKEQFATFPNTSMEKVKYYLTRDIMGFGIIDPLMHDPMVEDISCGGIKVPIYVWQRNFESIRTNIQFGNEDELNDFVMKMVHRSGKHVSAAFPVSDVALPGNHRMAILYQKEVTPKGTSFTIRKFKEEPYTIVDLINFDTLDINIAAYIWMIMEHKMSSIVIGSTASGKTTLLNAITTLVNPTYKIFTVEDVAEINIPHENWFSLVSRTGFGLENQGEIGLFELIKAGLRHRPDYMVVGEIRGEEAYVLFQALATGHSGLGTMHADSVDSAMKRLMQKPMNIPPAYLPLMNCAITIKRVIPRAIVTPGGVVSGTRRVIQVSEIISETKLNHVFTWDSKSDAFKSDLTNSMLLHKIGEDSGLSIDEVMEEFRKRVLILKWMIEEGIRDYRSVSSIVRTYYQNPSQIMQRVTALGETV